MSNFQFMNIQSYQETIAVRWADLDPNFHVRHSVYYDWGAAARMNFLSKNGLGTKELIDLGIGPILFREECIFRREVKFDDVVTIDVKLLKANSDFSKWSLQHQIKKGDTLAAIITVDGAWLDVKLRKLATPPPQAENVFNSIEKSENFEWL